MTLGNDNITKTILNGDVGVGTNTPGAKLDVVGKISTNNYLEIKPLNGDTVNYGTGSGRIWYSGSGGASSVAENSLHIDAGTGLTIGGNLGVGLTNPTEKVHVAGNIYVTGGYKDSSGSFGNTGDVLKSTGSGTQWGPNNAATIPFISTSSPISVQKSSTKTFRLEGVNFTPTTAISIPGFLGTIDSVNILSPTEMEITVTTTATTGTYDIVVSNNGVLNTQWPGNGVGLFKVVNEQ